MTIEKKSSSDCLLSICVATYNRAAYIGETLESILPLLVDGVELVIVDGNSPDNTSDIVNDIVGGHPKVRYFRELENSGVDGDYDKAVSYAKGEYCWLMTDDDFLVSDAVTRVLECLGDRTDLIVVDCEVRDKDMSRVLQSSRLGIPADRSYGRGDAAAVFVAVGNGLSFIGSVIIRRSIWLERERRKYYGSLFVHVGVIFQTPPIKQVKVLAEPAVVIRYGNAMWSPRGFEIWMFMWPNLIWSFPDFSDQHKEAICPREPWRSAKRLLIYRAIGAYGMPEYHKHIAVRATGLSRFVPWILARTPASLTNSIACLGLLVTSGKSKIRLYDLHRSQHGTFISRAVARLLRI